MGLIKCKECKEEISSKAKLCPKCGAPTPKKTSLFTWIVVIIFIAIYISISSNNESTEKEYKPAVAKIQQKTEKQIIKEENILLAKVKKIPVAEIYLNKNAYDGLLKLRPNNAKYKEKYNKYSAKVDTLVLKIGEQPLGDWDGVPYPIEKYLNETLKDPDSIKNEKCFSNGFTNNGWNFTCSYRAKNGFGAYVLEKRTFIVAKDVVVKSWN